MAKVMSGMQRLQARGQTSMRNDTSATAKAQHPENKDPSSVTPGPQYQQDGEDTSPPIKMALPKALHSNAHRTGVETTHLAKGHHVKNADGSMSFHMKSLDGEPVHAGNIQNTPQEMNDANDSMGEASMNGGGIQGDPYGISTAMKGMSA
jgi:hypothetical protein